MFTSSVTHDSLKEKGSGCFFLADLKRDWLSSSDDDVNVTDNPEDAPDDGESGDDDDQDWGERGPGV